MSASRFFLQIPLPPGTVAQSIHYSPTIQVLSVNSASNQWIVMHRFSRKLSMIADRFVLESVRLVIHESSSVAAQSTETKFRQLPVYL